VDNDGNALQEGALYFNTSSDRFYAYSITGAAWIPCSINGIDSDADATAITIDSNENVNLQTRYYFTNGAETAWNNKGDNGFVADYSSGDVRIRASSNANNNRNMVLSGLNAGVPNSDQLFLSYTGNVGIGTSSPAARLHIDGNNSGIRLTDNNQDPTNYYCDIYKDYQGASPLVINNSIGQLQYQIGGVSKFVIDGTGSVGIGTSTPDNTLHVHKGSAGAISGHSSAPLVVENSINCHIQMLCPSTNASVILFGDNNNNAIGQIGYDHSSDNMYFYTNAAEVMRINSSGYVGIGTTPSYPFHVAASNNTYLGRFQNTNANPYGINVQLSAASPDNNTNHFFLAQDSTTTRIIIYSDGDVLNHDGTYGTISDGRLKQDIVSANSQWDDIKAIGKMGKKYRHIKDVGNKGDEAKVMLGWVAQEVEQVSPGLIMHTFKDVEDEEGSVVGQEETLGIKSSILFTKNVMATAEALERIEALEAQRATLEAQVATLLIDVAELRSQKP